MRNNSICLLVLCAIFLSLIPSSFQYGTIYADTVEPVKADHVHFTDTTSEHIATDVFDIGSMTLSDPGGFNVHLPSHIGISSEEELNLHGDLGLSFGGAETDHVTITSSDHHVQFYSEDYFALFNDVQFTFDTSIEFDTASQAKIFADDNISLEGYGLAYAHAVNGNLDVSAPSILGTGSNVLVSSNDRIAFRSQTGFIDWTAESDIGISGDTVLLNSLENTEFVANQNITLFSEDAIQGTSTSIDISGLGDIFLQSDSTVDLKSQNGIYVRADTLNYNSDDAFMIDFRDRHVSRFVGLSKTRTAVETQNANIFAKEIRVETFSTQKILANAVTFNSVENFAVGSEETKNVFFNAGFNFLTFTLDDTSPGRSGDEIDFNGRFTTFNTTGDIVVHADREFRSNSGSTTVFAGSHTNVTALLGDITIDAYGGASFISSEEGFSSQARDDIHASAFELTITSGQDTLLSSEVFAASHTSDFFLNSPDILATATETSLLAGGRGIVNSKNILLGPILNQLPDISISAFKNVDFWATENFLLRALNSHFTIENGELLAAAGSFSVTGNSAVTFTSNDDSTFRMHGNLLSTTAQVFDINFRNDAIPEDNEFIASTYGGAIDLTAKNSFNFAADGKILFDSGLNILIDALNDVSISSENLKIQTLSTKSTATTGIDFDAKGGIITVNSAGKNTFDSSRDLVLTASIFDFTTPLFQFTASEEVLFSSTSGSTIANGNGAFSIHSDGFVTYSTEQLQFSAGGDFSFNAVDSVNVTADAAINIVTTNGDYLSTSEYFFASASSFSFTSKDDLLVTARNGISINNLLGSFTNIIDDTITMIADTITYDNKLGTTVTASKGSIDLTSGDDTLFVARYLEWAATGDFTIDSEQSIEFSTDEFQSSFTTLSLDLTIAARQEIDITSEGPLTFVTSSGTFTATSDTSLTVVSDDSVYFDIARSVLITNVGSQLIDGELPYIHINSGGSTEFWALRDNLYLNSSDVFTLTAGRIIADSWAGTLFLPDLGGIVVNNDLGSIYYDISAKILLNATNAAAPETSSHHLLSTQGIHWKTLEGGIYFDCQGTLADTNDESFVFSSSGKFGDIFVHSLFGGILLHALNDITYIAANDISLKSAYGAKYTADDDLTFLVPAGNFDIQSQRGISVTAGDGLDAADIIFNQLTGFYHVHAANQITLHSTGPVNDNSILVSGQSDIQFSTGNTGNLDVLASKSVNFDASGFFTAESTNNMLFNSTAGKVSYLAERNIEYTTENGPIVFSTFTGTPNGDITITAQNGDITFTSGNSTEFIAEQQTNLQAINGVEIRERDGSLTVATEAADSFIFLTSAGGLQVKTVADLVDPKQSASSIFLEATNNVEIGTKNTETIELNSDEYFTAGSFSRPIITLRAGGDSQSNGFTINSDGGIQTSSEQTITTTAGEDLTVTSVEGMFVHAEGPTTFKTTGAASTITIDSKTGIARLNGADYLSLTSADSIATSTSGGIDIIQTGNDRHDQLLFETIHVDITTGQHTLLAKKIDADLTNNFTWQTSGDGLIEGALDVNSHILFSAQTSFTAVSLGEVEIATHKDKGILTFETFRQGDISITTDFQSDLSFNAGGEFGYYSSSSIISSASFSLNAIDLDPNDDYTDGNIQIGAENKITQTSGEDILFSAQRSVTIETLGNNEDIGALLSISATGRLLVESSEDMTVRTTPGEGGSIYFTSLTDINIDTTTTSNAAESFVSFIADNDFTERSIRDVVYLFKDAKFIQYVGEDYHLTTNGKDPNDDFGIHLKSNNIDMEAKGGSVSYVAEKSAIQFTVQSDYNVQSTGGQFNLAKSSITVDAPFISANALRANINVEAGDGIIFNIADDIDLYSTGVDDYGNFGIRFQADSAAPFIITTQTTSDLDISSDDGLYMNGEFIGLYANDNIDFNFDWVNAAFNADALFNITASDFSIFSQQDVLFDSSSFQINAEATLNFDSSAGPIIFQANGPDAWIDWYSSGEYKVTATDINFATELGPGADLRFISSLGRIEFHSSGTPTDAFGNINSDSISFISMAGDIHFDGQGDDADIYTNAATYSFQTGGDFVVNSFYVNTDDNFPGQIIQSGGTDTFNSQSTISFVANNPASTDPYALGINSAASVNFLANGATNNPGAGGSIYVRLDEITIGSSGAGTTVSAPNTDSSIFIDSLNTDTLLTAGNSVQITADSKMKIPYNLGIDRCRAGAMFYTDHLMTLQSGFTGTLSDGSVGYLCICRDGTTAGIRCVYLREPPCDPTISPGQCPTLTLL